MDSQIKDEAWLAWIEQLAVAPASDDRENELPRSLFHCRLDDQPDHLVPERLLRPEYWEGLSDRPFYVNPACFFTPHGELPAACPRAGFAAQGRWFGSEIPQTRLCNPSGWAPNSPPCSPAPNPETPLRPRFRSKHAAFYVWRMSS